MLYLALIALSWGLVTFLDLGGADDDAGDHSDDPGSDPDGGGDTGGGTGDDIGGRAGPPRAADPTRIVGSFDNDTIDLRGKDGPYLLNLHEGGDRAYLGNDGSTVYAGSGPDRVIGGAGDDRVYLGDGRDQFDETRTGGGGNDLVRGGRGADKLVSRSGSDTLWGDLGADDLYTVDAPDQHAQGDTAYGGFGKDRLWLDGGDIGYGGADADQFTLRVGSGVVDAPTVIGDFAPTEDRLIIDLPHGQTATHGDLGFTGTDGTRITLTVQGRPVAVLDNVRFADLTQDVVTIR